MTNEELIARLQELPLKSEVTILDGFNGGGQPRTINLGPFLADPADYEESLDYDDIESPKGTKIILMGYGCY